MRRAGRIYSEGDSGWGERVRRWGRKSTLDVSTRIVYIKCDQIKLGIPDSNSILAIGEDMGGMR